MNPVVSLGRFALMNVGRLGDHLYRRATGLPVLRTSEVTPQLYLGGQYGLRALPLFRRIGVTGVVNMRTRSIHSAEVPGLAVLQLATPDRHAPTLEQLRQGVAFIQGQIDTGGKVYIHCQWGEGRGPSMIIAYLMSTGLRFEEALRQVKIVRPFVSLREAQEARLREFEAELAR